MDDCLAPEIPCFLVGSVENGKVSFAGRLETGEALTGTPTITEVATSDLVLDDEAVSTGALTINGESVPAGQALQFSMDLTSARPWRRYTLQVAAVTTSTPQQIKKGRVRFDTRPG